MIFFKLDFSPQKMYSLTAASKKVISRLEDNLIFRVYFTKNLPNPYGANGRYLRDFLEEYKAYSMSKIKFSFIDPANNDDLKREAQMSGIMPIRFTSVEKDKFELKEGYMGLSIMYKDKVEILPYIKDTESLEYEITSKIKKLIDERKKVVGILTGHNEANPLELPEFSEYFNEKYTARAVDTTKENKLPDDLDCLLIAGPKTKLTEYEIYLIDQFVMSGKPIGFLMDEYDISTTQFYASKIDNGLKELIGNYGVSIKPGLVLDYQCQRIGIQQRQGNYIIQNYVDYPFIPIATSFDTQNPIVKNFEKLAMPYPSALEINFSTSAIQDKKYIPLVYSSKLSWLMENVFMVNPIQDYKPAKDDKIGPFVLGCILEGGFTSFYKDKALPKKENVNVGQKIDHVAYSRIIISGTAAIAKKEFMSDASSVTYFMNIVDWLAEDYDLLSIRSRGLIYRPLKKVSDSTRIAIKYVSMLLLPVLAIIYGLFRWKTRQIFIGKKSKEILEMKK
ncbi:MAG: hypothetical protein A2474_08050 [Elusimicrobia bacterium RIFOXYC2_FULL_34_12]|nr:MAG: hypothetical protein A2474_08050 [Elusimicrobia bacterium RIFOXYC2_FULL_34_12]OGS37945.1 MAG: hypothetical protein A2551_00640 [Elusimicrobia bacterium RIFOXYD2_FULL_34_30]